MLESLTLDPLRYFSVAYLPKVFPWWMLLLMQHDCCKILSYLKGFEGFKIFIRVFAVYIILMWPLYRPNEHVPLSP